MILLLCGDHVCLKAFSFKEDICLLFGGCIACCSVFLHDAIMDFVFDMQEWLILSVCLLTIL